MQLNKKTISYKADFPFPSKLKNWTRLELSKLSPSLELIFLKPHSNRDMAWEERDNCETEPFLRSEWFMRLICERKKRMKAATREMLITFEWEWRNVHYLNTPGSVIYFKDWWCDGGWKKLSAGVIIESKMNIVRYFTTLSSGVRKSRIIIIH